MDMADAKGRFIWANRGIPGNTHDSLIFKSSKIYEKLSKIDNISGINYSERNSDTNVNISIKPFIIGDSAYELKPWLLKPQSNAVLSEMQRYFNYRLSRARMVIEGAMTTTDDIISQGSRYHPGSKKYRQEDNQLQIW